MSCCCLVAHVSGCPGVEWCACLIVHDDACQKRTHAAERFCIAYDAGLRKAIVDHPDDYTYGAEDVPRVVFRMVNTIRTGQGFTNSYGLKNACRALGIKPTKEAMVAFLKGE